MDAYKQRNSVFKMSLDQFTEHWGIRIAGSLLKLEFWNLVTIGSSKSKCFLSPHSVLGTTVEPRNLVVSQSN